MENIALVQADPADEPKRTKQDVLVQRQNNRFGIFIHWGAYSVLSLGRGSW